MTKTGTDASDSWGKRIQDNILDELDGATLSLALAHRTPIKSIHESRRRIKRSRAGLGLLREVQPKKRRREDRVLSDAAKTLGPIRDAHVTYLRHIETLQQPPYSPKVAALVNNATLALSTSGARVGRWQTRHCGPRQIKLALNRTYEQAWSRWEAANVSNKDRDLHRCRKSVKELYYQMSILAELGFLVEGQGELAGRLSVLDELGELLGDHHDLTFVGTVGPSEKQDLEVELRGLGQSVFALSPKKHRTWIKRHSK